MSGSINSVYKYRIAQDGNQCCAGSKKKSYFCGTGPYQQCYGTAYNFIIPLYGTALYCILRSIMLDRYLIDYCAPTLASLKTANLFTCNYNNWRALLAQIRFYNRQFSSKGIILIILRKRKNTALIYVCRKTRLEQDLQKPETALFLSECGYCCNDADNALKQLKRRLFENRSFPHEIGLFLGYPLDDVIGFIRNEGRNCKYTGFWKVYCNEEEAARIFEKFRKCRDVYMRLWQQGKSVLQLTVAA